MIKYLRDKLIDWCANKATVTIAELHNSLNPHAISMSAPDGSLKFIQESLPATILVETPTGFSEIKKTLKTVKYNIWKLKLDNGLSLECADDHIVMLSFGAQVYVKNIKVGNIIDTKFGMAAVVSVEQTESTEHMYDLELNDDKHLFYTNNIVSHNTETSCAFLLWSAIFKPDQTILVASNKSKNAMEIIGKIQYAYEELPLWLKPGIDENAWNKHECSFDNKSRIVATTTSADSGRGMAISLLYCDEFAFVKPHISREFFDSILPTISTGGSMIVSSTPNGDVGQYAELWRGANAGLNDFKSGVTFVPWDAPPGRGEEFKKKFIGLLGERKWRQEYQCFSAETRVDIEYPDGTRAKISIAELEKLLCQ